MTLLSIVSLLSAITLYRRIHLIEDTATTTLNSAAQGYMALAGMASLYDGEIVRGPSPDLPPMLWYKNHLFESWAGFIVSDEKGRCTLDPSGAEVITPNYSYNHNYYKAIYPNEMIYVIGQLHTLKKHRNDYERNSLVSTKIQEWKRNKTNFLDYFDDNKDGIIDEGEMRTAKHAATNFVDMTLEEVYQNPATHVVSKSEDGRPFIVTSIHPKALLKRYKRATVFHTTAWIILSIYTLLMQVG
ncbi:MAG: hypothetical protein V7749_01570 [Cocleimonas sp.]